MHGEINDEDEKYPLCYIEGNRTNRSIIINKFTLTKNQGEKGVFLFLILAITGCYYFCKISGLDDSSQQAHLHNYNCPENFFKLPMGCVYNTNLTEFEFAQSECDEVGATFFTAESDEQMERFLTQLAAVDDSGRFGIQSIFSINNFTLPLRSISLWIVHI